MKRVVRRGDRRSRWGSARFFALLSGEKRRRLILGASQMSERCASVPSAVSGMERPLVRCSCDAFSPRLGWVSGVMVGGDCGGDGDG